MSHVCCHGNLFTDHCLAALLFWLSAIMSQYLMFCIFQTFIVIWYFLCFNFWKHPASLLFYVCTFVNLQHFIVVIMRKCQAYKYCHVYEWVWLGFGLVIGFIDHLQVVTTSNYNSLTGLHALKITVTAHTVFSSLHSLHHSFPGNGFQRRMLPLLWVPELYLCFSYQLLTGTAHNYWTAAVLWLTDWLTAHQPTHSTVFHCTHSLNWTLLVMSCSLGVDPQRKPPATPFLLLRDVTAYVTPSSAVCVQTITSMLQYHVMCCFKCDV
jgi:hypothetical protein